MIVQQKQRNSRVWPGMVFALIALNFGVVAVTVTAARSAHASFAVEPHYDRKALHWDDFVRAQEQQRRLGWSVVVDCVEGGALRVRVLDRQQVPITGAQVDIEAFHHARAGQRLRTSLIESARHDYEGTLDIGAAGLWQFSINVRHGADTFTTEVTRAIEGGGRP